MHVVDVSLYQKVMFVVIVNHVIKNISKLNSILDENYNFNSIQDLSILSGVNINNLSRFIKSNKISGLNINL